MKSKYYETLFKKGDRTTTDFNIMAMFIISLISLFFLTFIFIGVRQNIEKYSNMTLTFVYLLYSYYLFYIVVILQSLIFKIKFFMRIFYTYEKIVGIFTYLNFIFFANIFSIAFFIMNDISISTILVYMIVFFFISLIGVVCFLFIAYKMENQKMINYFTNPSPQVVSPGIILLFSSYFITRNLEVTIATIGSVLICFASAEYLAAVIVKWRNPEYLEYPTKEAVEDAVREFTTFSPRVKKEKFEFLKKKALWIFSIASGLFYGAGKLIMMTTNETYKSILGVAILSSFFTACMSLSVLIVQYILYRKKRGNKR